MIDTILSLITGGGSTLAMIAGLVAAAFYAVFKIKKSGRDEQELKARRKDEQIIRKGGSAARDADKSGKLSDEFFRD